MSENKKTIPQERGMVVKKRNQSDRLIQVIEVKTFIGNGSEEKPYEGITEYWSKDGELLAVNGH